MGRRLFRGYEAPQAGAIVSAPKRTAGPWRWERETLNRGAHIAGRSPKIHKEGRVIAGVARSVNSHVKGGECDEANANAAFIVEACNAHDTLTAQVAVLAGALESMTRSAEAYMRYHTEKFYDGGNVPSGLYPAIQQARLALAALDGGK